MEQKRLEEIKAREQAATPGSWGTGNGDEESGFNGRNVVVAIKDGQPYVVMERAIYPNTTTFNKQVLADMEYAAHARTDIPALIKQHEQDQQQIATLQKSLKDNCKYCQANALYEEANHDE